MVLSSGVRSGGVSCSGNTRSQSKHRLSHLDPKVQTQTLTLRDRFWFWFWFMVRVTVRVSLTFGLSLLDAGTSARVRTGLGLSSAAGAEVLRRRPQNHGLHRSRSDRSVLTGTCGSPAVLLVLVLEDGEGPGRIQETRGKSCRPAEEEEVRSTRTRIKDCNLDWTRTHRHVPSLL